MRSFSCLALLLGFGAAMAADKDDKKKPPALKSAPSGEYMPVGEVTGVLAKAPDGKGNTITFRINQLVLQRNAGGLHLNKNHVPAKTQNVGADAKGKPGQKPGIPGIKEVHNDYILELTADVKIRNVKLPPKTDEKGAKSTYTAAELQKLKGGSSLRGYEADTGDLKPGQIVTLNLVKIKGDASGKAVVNRLFIEDQGTPIEEPKKKK